MKIAGYFVLCNAKLQAVDNTLIQCDAVNPICACFSGNVNNYCQLFSSECDLQNQNTFSKPPFEPVDMTRCVSTEPSCDRDNAVCGCKYYNEETDAYTYCDIFENQCLLQEANTYNKPAYQEVDLVYCIRAECDKETPVCGCQYVDGEIKGGCRPFKNLCELLEENTYSRPGYQQVDVSYCMPSEPICACIFNGQFTNTCGWFSSIEEMTKKNQLIKPGYRPAPSNDYCKKKLVAVHDQIDVISTN